MKAAVLIILYGGILYGLWLTYKVIEYRYGKRIRQYLNNRNALKEANSIIENARIETAERIKKRNEVIEVEVEEVKPHTIEYNVFYQKRLGQTEAFTELIIEND